MDLQHLHQQAIQSLLSLSTKEGINASSKDEIYGCIFGRDSALTILKILRAYDRVPNSEKEIYSPLLETVKNSLISLCNLQGNEVNIDSGEQPGKFIHEFRRDKYEHLVNSSRPWFLYPDGVLKNYDSIDVTPLALIAIYKYWEVTQDHQFLFTVLPSIEAGLNWIISYGDLDKDGLIEYEFPETRSFGGLKIQSWTDSYESHARPDRTLPKYPIAPVEVQGYSYLALRLWTKFYSDQSQSFAKKLSSYANKLKEQFNRMFINRDQDLYFAAQALDGNKEQIKTVTANPLLCLWAADFTDEKPESIVDDMFVQDFFKRGFMSDMYLEKAGVRTMSTLSPTFMPYSYHNGSFWPILNGLIYEALQNYNLHQEAEKLRQDSLLPITHFGTPVELYICHNDAYLEYSNHKGQTGCKVQAWTAAAILDMTLEISPTTGNS